MAKASRSSTTPLAVRSVRTGLPWRGMPGPGEGERDERLVGLEAAQRLRADEAGVELAAPAEARPRSGCGPRTGRSRTGGSRPRAAACRARPGRRAPRPAPSERVPDGRRAVRRDQELHAVLAGVARAAGEAVDAGDGHVRRAHARRQLALGDALHGGARLGTLDGQHRPALVRVGDLDVEVARVLAEPGEVLLVVRRVRDGQEAVLAEPVGEQVVEHAAVLAAEHRVLGAALGDAASRRSRGSAGGTPRPAGRSSRSRPCARRRTPPRRCAPPRAPGGCPRTGPASPSRRTGRAARRPARGARTAGVRRRVSAAGGNRPQVTPCRDAAEAAAAARRHWSTATARPSHPENGRSGVCWARRTPRTPSGSRTSSTCAVTGSAADMRRYSRRTAPLASGAPPNPYPDSSMDSQTATPDPDLLERELELRRARPGAGRARSTDAAASSRSRARPGSASRAS